MKLIQVVCDKTNLILSKEKKEIKYGEVFEIESEERAKEILAATYHDKPVAVVVEEPKEEDKEVKTTKKVSKKKEGK